ncbi:hypothetical protein JM946_26455 [Steroidobacter sp. S1-65]|uniref:DUF4870 domain-containing protein n=1 Tax=Steroidobacter gossypii TaxID=2805490 RepID=A0ABS1X4Y7_9GAMM|nr:hypothetical protein [Steroidobacter gossypii]MBM0108288.1 hypothetical protein [Steroidobacter gossypii]
MNQSMTEGSSNTTIANVIYVLYLLALINGITAIVGVIMAYIYKDGAPQWLRTHYELQIRTFWMGLLIGAVGFLLSWVLIGIPILLALAVWWIVRCVKGLRFVGERAPYPNYLGWGL